MKYISVSLWIILYFFKNLSYSQDKIHLMDYYQNIANKYLIKDKQVWNYVTINKNGVFIYSSFNQKQKNNPEFSLFWEELQHFKDLIKYTDRKFQFHEYQTKGNQSFSQSTLQAIEILKPNHRSYPVSINKPLSGYRIGIDPGHVAHEYQMAKTEARFINIKINKKLYQFYEAELNLSTALVLKDSLEAKGAAVLLTKDMKMPYCASKSFNQWYEEDFKKELRKQGMNETEIRDFIKKTSKNFIFRKFYSRKDLNARAEKINYFKPDFTIVIHYNADPEKKNWSIFTKNNYCLSFVPGAYLKDEMNTKLKRFDFLRILLTDYLSESTKLSRGIINGFETKLNVPGLKSIESPFYIKKFSLKVENGIYARNLRLCRLLNSPICYGEALLQDNIAELENLYTNNLKEGEISDRVIKVAHAYLQGIIEYVRLKEKEIGF